MSRYFDCNSYKFKIDMPNVMPGEVNLMNRVDFTQLIPPLYKIKTWTRIKKKCSMINGNSLSFLPEKKQFELNINKNPPQWFIQRNFLDYFYECAKESFIQSMLLYKFFFGILFLTFAVGGCFFAYKNKTKFS